MNWTIIATAAGTGATGVSVGWIGYLGLRRQAVTELARQDLQHPEPERSHRQGVYHNFLNHLTVFSAIVDGSLMDEMEFKTWERAFHEHANAVRLFGDRAVSAAVVDLAGCLAMVHALIRDEDEFDEDEE